MKGVDSHEGVLTTILRGGSLVRIGMGSLAIDEHLSKHMLSLIPRLHRRSGNEANAHL